MTDARTDAAVTVSAPRGAMVPPAEIRSYHGRPILQQPAWTWEVPVYFFVGGMAGLSATLAEVAEQQAHPHLARAARTVAAAGALASPPLLISDLGVPNRFHHMLRVFKPTSPLSVGSWLLAAFAPAVVASAGLEQVRRAPRLRRLAQRIGALFGLGMSTYTAVLVSNTAVPVWQGAGQQLPFVFAGSAAASAGAAALLLAPAHEHEPARRLALTGGLLELGASQAMEQGLGEIAEPYHQGQAGTWARAARWCTLTGTGLVALGGKRPVLRRAGAVALLAGSYCQRWAVYRAGFQSAADPAAVSRMQRQ